MGEKSFNHLKFTIMKLVGRIMKDAVVRQLKDDKAVVNLALLSMTITNKREAPKCKSLLPM